MWCGENNEINGSEMQWIQPIQEIDNIGWSLNNIKEKKLWNAFMTEIETVIFISENWGTLKWVLSEND